MKKINFLPLLVLFSFVYQAASAQGTAYTLKGGLTLGVQKWSGNDQGPLFKYHGAISAESIDETAQYSLFAQAGYHLKGSALRNQRFFDQNGNIFRSPSQQFIFKNISVVLGAKRKHDMSDATKAYYLVGLRGDYTMGTNLKKYKAFNEQYNTLFYPDDSFVKHWNYGLSIGGGFELSLGELVGASIEFTVNPDFSFQYKQPTIPNVYNPVTGMNSTIPERNIRNVTFEISAGLRLLRIVEYVD
ncbi:MAG: hypothetical protein IT258_13570 [Saprospiraceae bacterium]|nr:hypothetical protein [Saprospiraceae bacterium]